MVFLSGCLGTTGRAETVVKYVCPDGSIVPERSMCSTVEKTCDCGSIAAVQAQGAGVETGPLAADVSLAPAGTDAVNASANPCERMGCPPDAHFVGNSETKKFHECDCAQAMRISPKKRVCFISANMQNPWGMFHVDSAGRRMQAAKI